MIDTTIDDVMKLPVAKRADIYIAMQKDREVAEYFETKESTQNLFTILAERDVMFSRGEMRLTTVDEFKARLMKKSTASPSNLGLVLQDFWASL